MTDSSSASPPRSFTLIAIAAVLWNALGVVTYIMTVTMSDEALAAMSEAERALYTDTPVLVTAAYAIAVFGGTLASVLLAMKKGLAVPMFAVSLAAIVVQMGFGLFLTPMLEVQGAAAAALPVSILVVATYLLWYARSAQRKGWLT